MLLSLPLPLICSRLLDGHCLLKCRNIWVHMANHMFLWFRYDTPYRLLLESRT